MKLTLGKRYKTRDGRLTSPLRRNNDRSQIAEGYVYRVDYSDNSGTGSYTKKGFLWNTETKDHLDLVEEVADTSLKIEVNKFYRTRHGKKINVVQISGNKISGNMTYCVLACGDGNNIQSYTIEGFYYDQTNGPMLSDWDLISEWDEDDKPEPIKKPVEKAPKAKPRKIRYNNLLFLEAYEFAKETNKRYRFKDSEWLTFPEVKITKEQFDKPEWELEKND
jgi:hypothetical protein